MSDINQYSVLLSREGGILDLISPQGEVMSSIAVPAGRVRASKYLDLVPPGWRLEVAEGLEVFHPAPRLGSKRGSLPYPYAGGVIEVGANPDFRPTSASREEAQLRQTVARLGRIEDRLVKRMKALEAIERIPRSQEVIEPPAPEPAPKPQPEPAPADEKQ